MNRNLYSFLKYAVTLAFVFGLIFLIITNLQAFLILATAVLVPVVTVVGIVVFLFFVLALAG